MNQLGLSATLASSGQYGGEVVSLNSTIKLINERDVHRTTTQLGSGRFGTCLMVSYSHFKACKKVYKHADCNALCKEANILSMFSSNRLPYLFGVCTNEVALITSFHGFSDKSITLHCAIRGKSKEVLANYALDWKHILLQILEGIEQLHSVYNVLHNDIKSDNIVLAPNYSSTAINAVIIDFGKACDVKQGRRYSLSSQEQEEYKVNHPQVAPDLRDGLCKQCVASDVFSFGRIIFMISCLLKDHSLRDISNQCLLYYSNLRPCITELKQFFHL